MYILNKELLQENIRQQLCWSPFINQDQVKVEVQEGMAVLTIRVDTWMDCRAALENAFQGGAKGVDNRLEIFFPGNPMDIE
ncbi:MAG: BON domain-containing protein [Candidatus Cyclobacteriaceae bacterium M3_2C_046]